jgi:hypothetical protein
VAGLLGRIMVSLLLASGCGAAPDAVVGAIVTTAVAATASGISRANGGCYAGCPPGTVCNSNTGFCEVLPCRGICSEDQVCDETGPIAKCIAKKADIVITREREEGPPPEESQQRE